MMNVRAPLAERAIRRLTMLALAGIILLVGVLGGLAATINLSGAVIAAGTLVVDSYPKPVQHQRGGTVAALFVKNGDRVDAGEVLIRLDDTQMRANFAIVSRRLFELSARIARLTAERDGREAIAFPAPPAGADASVMEEERKLFADRRSSRKGREAQLDERIRQLGMQAEGLTAQQQGKRKAIAIIEKELSSLRPLAEQGVIPGTRVYALEREAADLEGELGSLVASSAEIKGKIAETELQIIQIGDDHRSEVSDELRRAQAETGEYSERLVAAEDQLRQTDIRSPQAGIVHQLAVHAAGAVVTPGEPVMRIVPDRDALTPELRLSPRDRDQVSLGQDVELRFSAFNQPTTPALTGQVMSVAADLTKDERTGENYYSIRVHVPSAEWSRLGKLMPAAGMPVEAFIRTSEHTVLAYLAKPFADQMARAFREE